MRLITNLADLVAQRWATTFPSIALQAILLILVTDIVTTHFQHLCLHGTNYRLPLPEDNIHHTDKWARNHQKKQSDASHIIILFYMIILMLQIYTFLSDSKPLNITKIGKRLSNCIRIA
jgi:hypothetical protein